MDRIVPQLRHAGETVECTLDLAALEAAHAGRGGARG